MHFKSLLGHPSSVTEKLSLLKHHCLYGLCWSLMSDFNGDIFCREKGGRQYSNLRVSTLVIKIFPSLGKLGPMMQISRKLGRMCMYTVKQNFLTTLKGGGDWGRWGRRQVDCQELNQKDAGVVYSREDSCKGALNTGTWRGNYNRWTDYWAALCPRRDISVRGSHRPRWGCNWCYSHRKWAVVIQWARCYTFKQICGEGGKWDFLLKQLHILAVCLLAGGISPLCLSTIFIAVGQGESQRFIKHLLCARHYYEC